MKSIGKITFLAFFVTLIAAGCGKQQDSQRSESTAPIGQDSSIAQPIVGALRTDSATGIRTAENSASGDLASPGCGNASSLESLKADFVALNDVPLSTTAFVPISVPH